jgi:asparagine synthase (glutamine-hydrolysing)
MCGIAGVFEYATARGGVSTRVIERMRDTLEHRGPDASGLWISDDRRVGLGHRRLSIVDLEHGAQPMLGAGGEVLVFNGEIYNYPRLRSELTGLGHVFRTNCDTEVILHLYARYGRACVQRLNGQFAFALWDPAAQELFFARDPIGEKPFHWADVGGTLVFGSEIKALLEHPRVTAAVNERALGPYLTNLVTTPPDTLYDGISKLPPGVLGICDCRGVRTQRYWDLLTRQAWSDVSLREAATTVRRLLDRSVHERLQSDVPVGVLLSGGLDSTALVGLLRERAEGVATFSVGYKGHPEMDERDHARRVAAHYGTDHHEVVVTERTMLEGLPSLIHHQDEPLADPVALPQYFVCCLARDHGVKVVLGGEGSDELFWGYTVYQRILRHERWMRLALRLPSTARRPLATLTPPLGRFAKARELMAGLADGRPLPLHYPGGMFRHNRARVLRAPSSTYGWGWAPTNADDSGSTEGLFDRIALDTQEHEFSLRLPELLLQRTDRFSMATSVEARVPFLDPDLVRFAYRLAPRLKLDGGEHKVVLKRAIADVVPRWVLERPKQGFDAPVEQWLDASIGIVLRGLLREEALRRYFDVRAIERAMSSGPLRSALRLNLWPVLNFALWHKRWIEGEPIDALIGPLLASAGATELAA